LWLPCNIIGYDGMDTCYKRMTVGAVRNILLLWLKVLVQDVGIREHGWKEDVKSLKINEKDALVHSKW